MVQLITLLCLLLFWGYQNVLCEKYEEQHVKVKAAVAKSSASWKAKVNPDWAGKSVEDLQQLVGLKSGWETQGKELKSKDTPEDRNKDAAVRSKVQPLNGKGKGKGRRRRQVSNLPQTFDWRNWTSCPSLLQIGDQQHCGSCWAVATVEHMADRHCLYSSKDETKYFSALQSFGCIPNGGCKVGGHPQKVCDYYVKKGLATGGDPYVPKEPAGCVPYAKVMSDQYLNKCPATCVDGRQLDSEKGLSWREVYAEEDIKNEIYNNGPVVAMFHVYEDFMHYSSGVYHYTFGKRVGGHAVRMIGWGIENGKPYWLLANQWKTTWGEQGYFKMARGRNECNIEKVAVSALPLNALG